MKWLHRIRPFVLLVLVVFVIRVPSYFEPHWYGDEDIYLAIGKELRLGEILYSSVIDHKPPLIYWLTAGLGSLVDLKFFLSFSVACSAVGILFLARQFKFTSIGTIISLMVFLLFSTLPLFEGNVFNAELLFISCTIWGMYFFTKGLVKKHNLAVSGMLFSIAILFKIPALFDLIAASLIFILFAFQTNKIKEHLLVSWYFLVGFLVPLAVSLLILLFQGSFSEFINYAILYNFKYMDDWSTVQFSPLIQFLSHWWIRVGLLSLILSFIGFYKQFTSDHKLILTWFWMGLFGTLLSLRPYAHYFLQVLPAASLICGLVFSSNTKLISKVFMLCSVGIIWLLITYLPVELFRTKAYYRTFINYMTGSSWESYASWFHGSVVEQYEIVEKINQHSTEYDTLFVWANAPVIYSQSTPIPATRYLTDYHIWSFNGFEEVYTVLEEHPPSFIVDCRRDFEDFPRFRQILLKYEEFHSTPNCNIFNFKNTDQMLQ